MASAGIIGESAEYDMNEFKKTISTLENKVAELKEELSKEKSKAEERINTLNREMGQAEATISTLNATLKALSKDKSLERAEAEKQTEEHKLEVE